MGILFNKGCGGHHLSEGKFTGRIKTIPSTSTQITIEKEVRRECKHDGCNHVKRTWERVNAPNHMNLSRRLLEEHLERMTDFERHRELSMKEARCEMKSREIETLEELEEFIQDNYE